MITMFGGLTWVGGAVPEKPCGPQAASAAAKITAAALR
jgi:hypothetical protein